MNTRGLISVQAENGEESLKLYEYVLGNAPRKAKTNYLDEVVQPKRKYNKRKVAPQRVKDINVADLAEAKRRVLRGDSLSSISRVTGITWVNLSNLKKGWVAEDAAEKRMALHSGIKVSAPIPVK